MKGKTQFDRVTAKLMRKHKVLFEELLAFGNVDQLYGFLNNEGLSLSVHLNHDEVWAEPHLMPWDGRRLGKGKTVKGAMVSFIRANFTPSGYGLYPDINSYDLRETK